MKLIDKKLYLTIANMVECGVKENYLWKAKSIGTKCWHFIDDPEDKRKVLIGYEELKDNYKEMVIARFGNPYDMVARQPILDMIIQDAQAHTYFNQYRFDNNKYLTIGTVNKYTRAASWLNMMSTLQEDRLYIKQKLGLTVPEFYTHAGILINNEKANGKSETYTGILTLPGDFPSSYQRLMNKVRTYKEGGFDSLIDPMYGNKKAAKIGKTAEGFDEGLERQQIAVIRSVAAKHNNLDASQVTNLANILFEKNGWCTIGESRVYQIMQENKVLLTPGRRGKRAYDSEVAMQVQRVAPKFPLYYWTLDGWTAELLFQENGTYSNRLVVVVVLDAMNNYPVGYAIGERENAQLIREANRNALLHIKELFQDNYRPYQIQSDHYAIKQMTPFYQAMAHLYTPAEVGNAKAKRIEPYFKYLNKTYCQLQPNWSGFGVTANKKNQVNAEMLNLMKKTFPDKAGVIAQIEGMIMAERKKKLAEYLLAWDAAPAQNKNTISDMDWLMVFGEPIGDTNKIVGQGIIKQIDNMKITYDSFEPEFRKNFQLDWQIIGDKQDLSKVLAVSPDGTMRFVLHTKIKVAMDILSATDEQHAYRSQIAGFNEDRKQEIINTYTEDANIVSDIIAKTPLAIDDVQEAALKLMFTTNGQQKEGIQDAKRLKAAQQQEQKYIEAAAKEEAKDWQNVQLQYMHSKTDFSQYQD
ncbi:MAG: hypothetical protein ACK4EY_14490 [Flavipsychrobacter sp.]